MLVVEGELPQLHWLPGERALQDHLAQQVLAVGGALEGQLADHACTGAARVAPEPPDAQGLDAHEYHQHGQDPEDQPHLPLTSQSHGPNLARRIIDHPPADARPGAEARRRPGRRYAGDSADPPSSDPG